MLLIVTLAGMMTEARTDDGLVIVVDARNAAFPVEIDPLISTAEDTFAGDRTGAHFGSDLASGDLNHDGLVDLVVGARNCSHGQIGEGGVFVYYGTAAGFSTAASWTWEPDEKRATLGRSLSIGDFNGDGVDDLAVGAPRWTDGEKAEGRVLVFWGSDDGLA
ncbi:MAG: integrin alpha, partial [Kiritimatiellae bacterium]|nr:integrin alpha [Kiritimatiellia bacterium]